MVKELYIIRHGETELNRKRIVQGSGVDASLNDTGRAQAQAFFDTYKAIDFDLVVTSALKRTHETVASFIAKGIPWIQYPEINEISWGVQEGKTATPDSLEIYHAVVGEWKSGNFDARIPEGESAAELGNRLNTFIDSLKTRTEKKILICSHGRSMRGLMCQLKGVGLTKMQEFSHHNTGLYEVHYDGEKFNFIRNNNLQHLE